jgi:hypothetical protein
VNLQSVVAGKPPINCPSMGASSATFIYVIIALVLSFFMRNKTLSPKSEPYDWSELSELDCARSSVTAVAALMHF